MSDTKAFPMEPPASFWWKFAGKPQRTVREELAFFLGADYDRLQTHEKSFPGYDLASLHRALKSIADEALGYRVLGGINVQTVRELFDALRQPWFRNSKPMVSPFSRVAVDVDEEESLASNQMSFIVFPTSLGCFPRKKTGSLNGKAATIPEPMAAPERAFVMLAVAANADDYYDNIDGRNATPRTQIKVSVACRDKGVADRFFQELEDRRRRLSVYRGKVIDPVVGGGAIHSIGFRPIERVTEDDLILPDEVKRLIRSSILGFYKHADRLEALGIEMKRGVLFHSQPGTGKTSISLYLAGLLNHFTICFVSGERLLYPREVCRMARYLQPSMVVFEDVDLVAQDRNTTGLATVLGELMNQIDGCEVTDQVLFVLNTNSLERLEQAVKNRPGRVDQIVQIPLPDEDLRLRLIRLFGGPLQLPEGDLSELVRATDGATPAMLKEVVKRAAVMALATRAEAAEVEGAEPVAEDAPLPITEADLLLATEQVRAMRDPDPSPGRFGFGEGPRR